MSKDASYHESAIRYNEEIAAFAEDLTNRLEHEEIQKWSRAVGKQHRFHSGRHKKALLKLKDQEAEKETPSSSAELSEPVVGPSTIENTMQGVTNNG